jgi:hypothetical protein
MIGAGGNPLDLNEFARLADTRLDSVLEDYLPEYQQMIDKLFGKWPLDKAFAELFDIGSLGDIPEFNGKLEMLGVSPGFYTRIEPKEYAGGIQLTQKLIEDKQYPVLDDLQEKLSRSFVRSREKAAVKAFTGGFSTQWDFMTNEEQVALFSASHTTKSGYNATTLGGYSNYITAPISKLNIAAARVQFRRFRDDIGELYDSEPDAILVPESQYDVACECVGYMKESGAKSELDPDSAKHKINVLYKGFEVIPWRRLDDYSTTHWFMLDLRMAKKFLLWIDRVEAQTGTNADFNTFAVQQRIRGRYGWGWRNWRFGLGANS